MQEAPGRRAAPQLQQSGLSWFPPLQYRAMFVWLSASNPSIFDGPANGRQGRPRFVQFYSITLGYYVRHNACRAIRAAFVVQSPAAAKSRRRRRNVAHSGKPKPPSKVVRKTTSKVV